MGQVDYFTNKRVIENLNGLPVITQEIANGCANLHIFYVVQQTTVFIMQKSQGAST